ncbi:unnamed protein product, partial [Mycena citricolor]
MRLSLQRTAEFNSSYKLSNLDPHGPTDDVSIGPLEFIDLSSLVLCSSPADMPPPGMIAFIERDLLTSL